MTDEAGWRLPGTRRDGESITKDWQFTGERLIEGVVVREMKNVATDYGHLTELWRRDWALDAAPVDQVFQSIFEPGAISAWHAHAETTDRLFVSQGRMCIVLFDARPDSPTHGLINELQLGTFHPGTVVVPPRVYHGVQNRASTTSVLVNIVDRAYEYVSPDHYRLPIDSPEIPYRFSAARL